MPTITEWTLAIISDVIHFGFIIAILYTLRRFYKYRYCQALQKRSPLLIYLINICFIFDLLHQITDKIAYIHGELDVNFEAILSGEKIRHPHIVGLISAICHIFSLHGMAIMWIARSWIVYFNSQYALELQKTEWGVYLNDRYSETLWFVKHRKDYGSTRVIYRIAITWYIIEALLQTFLLLKSPDIQKMYDSASWLIKFIMSVTIWFKIPSFNDIFGIKKEMQLFFRVAGIGLMFLIGYTIEVIVFGHNLWIFMIAHCIFGVINGCLALILNGFIFHSPNYNHLISTNLETSMFRQISSCSRSCDASTGNRLSLSQVLRNKELIERLFAHLTDEFSIELLLALVEFKQFHDLMTNDDEFMADTGIQEIISANSGDTRISESILFRISFSDELPKSNIVHGNPSEDQEDSDQVKRYLRIAQDIYNKYVSSNAEFEVNLGYACRQKIAYFIQQHNDLSAIDGLSENEKLELFILFHEAANELYQLLHSSHNRCVRGNKYFSCPKSISA